jgi:hypothetical protein
MIGVTPFSINFDYHPHLNFDLTEQQDLMVKLDVQKQLTKLYEIHSLIQDEMGFMQAREQ